MLVRALKLPLGIAIALSGVVYALTAFDLSAHLVWPAAAESMPVGNVLFGWIWAIAAVAFVVRTESRLSEALQIALVSAILICVGTALLRIVPALVWGGLGWHELVRFSVFGGFFPTPAGAPWYVSIGKFLSIIGLYIGIPCVVLAVFSDLFGGKADDSSRHIRGRVLLNFDQAAARAGEERAKEPGPTLHWGWLELPWSFATKHFLACGSTGSGKTTLIRLLMQSVLPRIGTAPDERALIYDAKQDILSILDGMQLSARLVLLNPFDERSAAWDIAADVTEPSTAQQIATILIPEEENAAQRFFSDASRHLLAGVMRRFIKTAPGRWTLADVVYAMLDQGRLEQILSNDPDTTPLLTYLRDARTGNSVLSTVLTKMQPYEFIAAAWSRAEEKVSLRDWVKGDYILILGNDEAQRSALDAINQAIFKRVVELVLAQDNSANRRTWFFLDEVREAGKLDGLQSLMTKGRSKGGCVVLGFQDIDGMKDVYGEYLTSEITGQCACKALLRTDSAKTAEWASALLGEREFVEITNSSSTSEGSSKSLNHRSSSAGVSSSSSEHVVRRPIVLPSELMALPLPGGGGAAPLCAYFIAPNLGAYSADVDWFQVQSMLRNHGATPAVMSRSVEHQALSSWADHDRRRLGLAAALAISKEQIQEKDGSSLVEGQTGFSKLRAAARRINRS